MHSYLSGLPTFSITDWGATLIAAGSAYTETTHGADHPFFVQVGGMDGKSFDPIYKYVQHYKWPGLVVEPLADYFGALQQNYADVPGMRFERAAIAGHDGTLSMQRIMAAALARGVMPDWTGGVSSSIPGRGVLGGQTLPAVDYERFVAPHVETVEVPAMTWPTLLARHGVARFDVLVVDVEGAEWPVLQQVDLAGCQPRLAYIEYVHMPDAEFSACFEKFNEAGYRAFRQDGAGENILFVR